MDDGVKLSWGRDLPGELAEKWPKDADGEFVPPAFLTEIGQQDMEDSILVGMLGSYGIPCFKWYPHYGGFGKLILGMSAEGVALFVPETMAEDAKALMEGEPDNEEL